MFDMLVESAAQRPVAIGPRLLAFSAHCAVVVIAAVWSPHPIATPVGDHPSVPIDIYVAPVTPRLLTGGQAVGAPMIATSGPAPAVLTTAPDNMDLPAPEVLAPVAGNLDPRVIASGEGPHQTAALPSLEDAVMLAGEVDEPASVLLLQPPAYPRALAAAAIEGRVILEFVVDTAVHCEPGSVRVLGSTHPGFEEAAIAAVSGTRYRPAKSRGRLVRQLVHQDIAFRMR